jgi:deoxyribonuclease IV
MFKIGLKLWSTNKNYIDEAIRLYDEKVCDYIELYIVPGSLDKYLTEWKQLNIPFIIHAPHHSHGMNLSVKESHNNNTTLANEVFRFADDLQSDVIIFHPGVNGNIEESARQIKLLNDNRIVIENKPYFGLKNDICVGYSHEDIKFLLNETSAGFCLDFAHAIFAANALQKDSIDYVRQFIKLKPEMYHLCDGYFDDKYDSHKNLGKGTFPLNELVHLIPESSFVTVETEKNSGSDLDDFRGDVTYLLTMMNKNN